MDSHFKTITNISDVQPFVLDKKEIRFLDQHDGVKIGCYLFVDSKTFDSVEALECRGVAFDSSGDIISRPLHKFFNIGEKEWLSPDQLLLRDDIKAIYEKLDGSMIATAWMNGELLWRSKKSFNSQVVKLATLFTELPENENIKKFACEVASSGMTAIFEITHPEARIVVEHTKPALRLLHVRNNIDGQYVMLDKEHSIHRLILEYQIPVVQSFNISLAEVMESLENMKGLEGYVIQFNNGDMVKIKCPWYARLHRSISFSRERDIAMLCINGEIDDVKGQLVELGIDLAGVNEVEARLKEILTKIFDEVEEIYKNGMHLDRKSFAIANKENPLFGFAMNRYLGKEVSLLEWYGRNRLKDDFGLKSLLSDALAEELEI